MTRASIKMERVVYEWQSADRDTLVVALSSEAFIPFSIFWPPHTWLLLFNGNAWAVNYEVTPGAPSRRRRVGERKKKRARALLLSCFNGTWIKIVPLATENRSYPFICNHLSFLTFPPRKTQMIKSRKSRRRVMKRLSNASKLSLSPSLLSKENAIYDTNAAGNKRREVERERTVGIRSTLAVPTSK